MKCALNLPLSGEDEQEGSFIGAGGGGVRREGWAGVSSGLSPPRPTLTRELVTSGMRPRGCHLLYKVLPDCRPVPAGQGGGPHSRLTLWVLHLSAGLGRVEETTLPTYQVQRLHQVGAAQVLVDEGPGRGRCPEGQQGQQGQEAHPQGHGRVSITWGRAELQPAGACALPGTPTQCPRPDALREEPTSCRAWAWDPDALDPSGAAPTQADAEHPVQTAC